MYKPIVRRPNPLPEHINPEAIIDFPYPKHEGLDILLAGFASLIYNLSSKEVRET